MDLGQWIQLALNNSSMGLKAGALRGDGFRRNFGEDVRRTFVLLHNQLLNKADQGVYIGNPFYVLPICTNGIGKPGLNGPETIKEKPTPGSADQDIKTVIEELDPPVTPEKIHALLPSNSSLGVLYTPYTGIPGIGYSTYIEYGMKKFSRAAVKKNESTQGKPKDFFFGVCDDFTCATIAALANRDAYIQLPGAAKIPNPLPVETPPTIEQFGLRASNLGHTFCVVGRAKDSNPKEPSTWGDACFVVDHWFALQRVQGHEVIQSIFRPSHMHTAGTRDKEYFDIILPVKSTFYSVGKMAPDKYAAKASLSAYSNLAAV